jgi:hypothetical protein
LHAKKEEEKKKKYNKKISLKICTKQEVNLRMTTRLSHSTLLSEVGSSSQQWFEGK